MNKKSAPSLARPSHYVKSLSDDQIEQSWAVVRAMNVHKANGLIRDWKALPWSRLPFHLEVDVVGGKTIELKSLREATVFVHALASAHHALLRSRESEKV